MTTLKTGIHAEMRKLTRELTSDEIEVVSGGALQAHFSMKGQKQGRISGEDPVTKIAIAVINLLG
jgi:hypothetical protein